VQPRDEWLALGAVPAIIREEQYVRAQDRMSLNHSFSPRSHKAETYLLRALVSCGACRLACTGRTMNGRYEYYWCKGKLSLDQSRLSERCPARYIPAQQLDALVWLDHCQLLAHPQMIRQALERAQSGCWLPQELQAQREQLSRGEKAIANQQERLTEAYLGGVIQLEEYRRRRQDLEQRRSAVGQQQRQLAAQAGQYAAVAAMASSVESFCQRVQAGLAQATFRQKRQLVELLIDRVVVTEEQVEIRYVIPTSPRAEHTRFSQLRTDYRDDAGARAEAGSFDHCPLGAAVCTSAERADSIGNAAAEPVVAGGRNVCSCGGNLDLFISGHRLGREHHRLSAVT
jgi:site-specific DNA recombinase